MTGLKKLTANEQKSAYFTLGNVKYASKDVKGYLVQDNMNCVFLKNGVSISYPNQENTAHIDIDNSFRGNGTVNIFDLKNASVNGSDKSDLLYFSFCEDINVDVQEGNSFFGLYGDKVEIAPIGNKNIKISKDTHDKVIDHSENKVSDKKPPVDLSNVK